MSTAVAITGIITGTLVKLAFIGAGLKLLLAAVPRLSMSNPRQVRQPDPKPDAQPTGTAGHPGLPKVVGT